MERHLGKSYFVVVPIIFRPPANTVLWSYLLNKRPTLVLCLLRFT